MEKSGRTPHWAVSCTPLVFLVGLLFFVVRFYGSDSLGGASQVALILSSALAISIGMLGYGMKWSTFAEAMEKNMASIATATMILFLIGAVSGSWMASGVVPTLVCYGLKIISPKIFLFAACAIAALVAVMTGSSWTTIATIGVALLTIGQALGFSPGWIAGAIISGAYFGDKISPLSDTTVLASSSAGTPLFTHIRYMLITTVPSITVALVVFLSVSLLHPSMAASHSEEYTSALRSSYTISPWLLLVPVFTLFLILKKVPAILTLMLSSLAAAVMAMIFQTDVVMEIAGMPGETFAFKGAFMGTFNMWFGSTSVETGSETVNELVSTSGMRGMFNTVFLIVCAITFGASMIATGMIQSITEAITRHIRHRTSIVGATVFSGFFSNVVTGDQYISIILSCSMFRDTYERNGYENRLLSRSVEDSATVTSVLIPWNSCGMTQATVLGVATPVYLPYCIFNILSPLMSVLVAALGFRIYRKDKVEKEAR